MIKFNMNEKIKTKELILELRGWQAFYKDRHDWMKEDARADKQICERLKAYDMLYSYFMGKSGKEEVK